MEDTTIRAFAVSRDAMMDTVHALNKKRNREDRLDLKTYLHLLSKLTPKQAQHVLDNLAAPRKRTAIVEVKGI
jgi:hypothetical protein